MNIYLKYDINGDNVIGAELNLNFLGTELGFIPHPQSVSNNPGLLQELATLICRECRDEERFNMREVMDYFSWQSTLIGYQDDDFDWIDDSEPASPFSNENEFDEYSMFHVWWGNEYPDNEEHEEEYW